MNKWRKYGNVIKTINVCTRPNKGRNCEREKMLEERMSCENQWYIFYVLLTRQLSQSVTLPFIINNNRQTWWFYAFWLWWWMILFLYFQNAGNNEILQSHFGISAKKNSADVTNSTLFNFRNCSVCKQMLFKNTHYAQYQSNDDVSILNVSEWVSEGKQQNIRAIWIYINNAAAEFRRRNHSSGKYIRCY